MECTNTTDNSNSGIDEAEVAFVRQKFVRSLRLANSILERGCSDRASASVGAENDEGTRTSTDISSGGGKGGSGGEGSGNDDEVISIRSPLIPCAAATNEASKKKKWRIRIPLAPAGSTRRKQTSPYDRAAAIVLQSVYEIENGNYSPSDRDDIDIRDQRLISNLSTLNRYYHSTPMSLEVACVYIQFCSAIGWETLALASALELLIVVLRSRCLLLTGTAAAAAVSPPYEKDWPPTEMCKELLYLVLTDLLPRVKRRDDCEELLRQLSQVREQDRLRISGIVEISSKTQLSSVDVLLSNIARLKMTLDPCFLDMIEECNDKLQQIHEDLSSDIEMTADTEHMISSQNDVISSVVDRIASRSSALTSDTQTDKNLDDPFTSSPAPPQQSISDMIRNNIVEPLWESDDRWANRAMVAAVGLASITLWRRRRQLVQASRSTGHALLAPFREVVEALSLQDDKR